VSTDYLQEILARHSGNRGTLLVALQEIQDHAGYVPHSTIAPLANALGVSMGEIMAVTTFYKDLRTTPPGRHRLCVCRGDSCAAVGARQIAEAVESQLGISAGDNTPGGELSYDTVYCLGNCALSPSISIDGEVYGRTTPEQAIQHIKEIAGD
jgi:formate dehydrogenase subunit gamma